MKTIHNSRHPVYIGNDSLSLIDEYAGKYSRVFVLADEKTKKHCLPLLKKKLSAFDLILIKSGEKNKNISTCGKIWEVLSKHNADRKCLLVNLGGGVIGDMGGFAASTYKRGIDFINIPTTLLSQVDASVGGKTGIDFSNFKNQIGTFSFPKAVFINPVFLKTLNQRELLSGYAEVLKHGLIEDKNYWNTISQSKPTLSSLEEIIHRSVEIKNRIVTADPFEKGERKKLNFGHTVGHAVESALLRSKKPLLHGEAITIGMICESYLSVKVNALSIEELGTISNCLMNLYKLNKVATPFTRLKQLMQQDKKNNAAEINFTLLTSIGQSSINHTCSLDLIEESVHYFNQLCK